MGYLFLDFETKSCAEIKKTGAEAYARHPSTDILCMGWAIDDGPVNIWTPDQPWRGFHRDGDGRRFEKLGIVAHNAAFEIAIWNACLTRLLKCAPIFPQDFYCTMAMSYAMALPGSLADAANALGLPIQKDSAGHRVMMQLSQPRGEDVFGEPEWWTPEAAPEKFEKLYAYCKTDVEVERQLFKRLMQLSPSEQELWVLDRKINDRGVRVDLDAARTAIELVEIEKERLIQRMRKVTGGAVATCSAVGQLADWLRFRGVELKGVSKSDVLGALEQPNLPSDCHEALLIRQEAAKPSTAKLEAMLRGVCDDGRLRGMFQYNGAGATGRFAGRRVQLHNFPRPKLAQEEIEDVFQVLEDTE